MVFPTLGGDTLWKKMGTMHLEDKYSRKFVS